MSTPSSFTSSPGLYGSSHSGPGSSAASSYAGSRPSSRVYADTPRTSLASSSANRLSSQSNPIIIDDSDDEVIDLTQSDDIFDYEIYGTMGTDPSSLCLPIWRLTKP
jgi:hypothetical protein